MSTCEDYRIFLQNLASTAGQGQTDDDIVTSKHSPYHLFEFEIISEATNLIVKYLVDKRCPVKLIAPITRNILNTITSDQQKTPDFCGYDESSQKYDSFQLQNITITSLKSFCQRLQDNVELNKILSSVDVSDEVGLVHVSAATKNRRRYMEDRHVCIDDFNATYNVGDNEPTSFYGIFDGHSGYSAATYSASQLPYFLANDSQYQSDPFEALRTAFQKTDNEFKNKETSGGCTAVCALYQPKKSHLYIAWVGDSKALLARNGKVVQLVEPHKPNSRRESNRITELGGAVMHVQGAWRVNGVINTSRAIGDTMYKPFISSVPDMLCVDLDHQEDFLVLACDGLWDYVQEEDVALAVYNSLEENCDDLNKIPKRLIELAKQGSSQDNITVTIVFFKHPSKIRTSSIEVIALSNDKSNMSETITTHVFADWSTTRLSENIKESYDTIEDKDQTQITDGVQKLEKETTSTTNEEQINDDNLEVNRREENLLTESFDESEDDEWKHIQLKEGVGEKQADHEIGKENIPINNIENELKDSFEKIELNQSSDIKRVLNSSGASVEDMHSQLKPNANESHPSSSPPPNKNCVSNGYYGSPVSATARHCLDEVVSQSPRKGRGRNMENISLPSENEFGREILNRPHEYGGTLR